MSKEEDTAPVNLDKQYKILSGACGTITFKGKIGNDLSAASDSLEAIRQMYLTSGCPDGNPCHEYYIEKQKMEVAFDKNGREFYGIIFMDSANNTSIFSMSDVLDTKGNHYSQNS